MRYGIFLLLLCVMFAQADDGASGIAGAGGRARLLDGEHQSIRMVKEWVRIDIYPRYYDVSAQFLFENTGGATTVKMGFPEGGGGDGDGVESFRTYREQSGFSRFSTTVDGIPVTASRTVKVAEDHRYDALWMKTVRFAKGQQRTIRVEYRAKPGFADESSGYHANVFSYNFTGGNWKGILARADLLVVSHIPGALLIHPTIPDKEKIAWVGQKQNQLAISWKDWQAEGKFACGYALTYQNWLILTGRRSADPYTYDFRPMITPAYTLTLPGTPAYLDWSPPLREIDGVIYIKVRSLMRYLTAQAQMAEKPEQVSLSQQDGTVELQVGRQKFHFTRGGTTMKVDGNEVQLPARVWLSVPAHDYSSRGKGLLYVPLAPIVKALDGKMKVDKDSRKVSLDIPPFWE